MLERADCETSPDISGSVKTSEFKLGMFLWDHSYHEIKKNIVLKWQVETNFLKERKKNLEGQYGSYKSDQTPSESFLDFSESGRYMEEHFSPEQ